MPRILSRKQCFLGPSNIYNNSVLFSKRPLRETENKNTSDANNAKLFREYESTINSFPEIYDEYLRLRKEDGEFNENLGAGKQLVDALMRSHKLSDETIKKLIRFLKSSNKHNEFSEYLKMENEYNNEMRGYKKFKRCCIFSLCLISLTQLYIILAR